MKILSKQLPWSAPDATRPTLAMAMATARPPPALTDQGFHDSDGPLSALTPIDPPRAVSVNHDDSALSFGFDRELDRQVRAWAGQLLPAAEREDPDWMFRLDVAGQLDCLDRDEINTAILTAPNDMIRAYLCGYRALLIAQGITTGAPYGAATD